MTNGAPQPPAPPTLERSLRLAVIALNKQAHHLSFEAHVYQQQHLSAGTQMERAYKTYHQLRQAADILAEPADDAQYARRAATLSEAKVGAA
jgi:hypothetical protein